MTQALLGRLERVDLRHIWRTEAADFTPWLARAENLAVLAETIRMELELEAQEKNVGPFRADILCKDVENDSWVLIENQLEPTDHKHLGQLLTYAAGLQTVTIVWVAAQFTEEHRAALDWLNEITDQRFRFFGLEVELWRIGGSPPAPRFNVVSKPNDWSQSVARAARQIEEAPSEIKAQQLQYWQSLKGHMAIHAPEIRTSAPRPRHWIAASLGRSGVVLSATMSNPGRRIGAEVYLRGDSAKARYAALEAQKAEIEREMGEALSWEELPDRIACRIALYKGDIDPMESLAWGDYHAWHTDALLRLARVFRPRIRDLSSAESETIEE